MSSKAGILKEHKENFILDEGKLRKLVDLLSKHASKKAPATRLEYTVYRRDDSFYVTGSVDEVLADDNVPGKDVTVVTVSLYIEKTEQEKAEEKRDEKGNATSHERNPCRIRFRSSLEVKADWSISDPDRAWCFLLAEDVETQIQRTLRPRRLAWLRDNHLIDMPATMLIVGLPLAALGLWLYVKGLPVDMAEIEKLTVNEKLTKLLAKKSDMIDISVLIMSSVWILMALIMIFADLRPLSRALKWMDRSVFYWGDQMQAFDAYKSLLTKVKWGIVVAFIVSGLASFLVARFLGG